MPLDEHIAVISIRRLLLARRLFHRHNELLGLVELNLRRVGIHRLLGFIIRPLRVPSLQKR